MKNWKRLLAGMLAAIMLLAMIPVAAFADESDDTPWLQLESVKDTKTGKATLTVKLNMDKIKKGNFSALKIDEIFTAVLGDKEVANSGIISMEDLLKIFPIVYDVDEEGKATASGDSVLNVVGATAILGLDTIVGYVNDFAKLIEANKEVLSDPDDGIQLSKVVANTILKNIIIGLFYEEDGTTLNTANIDKYVTAAGKSALSGVAEKKIEEVFASLTDEEYDLLFNGKDGEPYLDYKQIVKDLATFFPIAIANSTYKNISDYLTEAGQTYVDANKVNIAKDLLKSGQVTLEQLSDYLIIKLDNVKNLFPDDGVEYEEETYKERGHLANAILKALIQTKYIQDGEAEALAAAIRDGDDLFELASYLKLDVLLEDCGYPTVDSILVKALVDPEGLVTTADNATAILKEIRKPTPNIDTLVGYVNANKLIDKDEAIAALELETQETYPYITNYNHNIIDNSDNLQYIYNLSQTEAGIADYLKYVNTLNLLAKLYGIDYSDPEKAIKVIDAVAKQILTETGLIKAGKENDMLALAKDGTATIENYIDASGINLDNFMKLLGFTDNGESSGKADIARVYAKLLKSSTPKSGKTTYDVAKIIRDYSSEFENLIEKLLESESPFASDLLVEIVKDFILNDIGVGETDKTDRAKAFEANAEKQIGTDPKQYINDDGVDTLFGDKLIYYFFDSVDPENGTIGGNTVTTLLDKAKVKALLGVDLKDGSAQNTLMLKLAVGYETYLTEAGEAFLIKKAKEGAVAAKTIEALVADPGILGYFNIGTLLVDLFQNKAFKDEVFAHAQDYIHVKGMNKILQYWLTVEGADAEDFTDIIETLQKKKTYELYMTTNGEEVSYSGKKLLSDAIVSGFSKFFENAIDLVIDGKDVADTSASRHLVIDGTALLERVFNAILPTLEEIDNIRSDGYLKTFNLVLRMLPDDYYWTNMVDEEKFPEQKDNGDVKDITLDLDVKIYLTGDLEWIKKPIEQHRAKIENDFKFNYLYDYKYELFGDTAKYKALPKLEKAYAKNNRYNKVVKTDSIVDKLALTFDLPSILTIVYRHLAESDLAPATKLKLYNFVYEKTPNDLIDEYNRFTVKELQDMVDALDLDAVMADLYADPRGRELIMIAFDFIGNKDLIAWWYENPEMYGKNKDGSGFNDDVYVNPAWSKNPKQVTAEWTWHALTHWKDLEQATNSRGIKTQDLATLLDAILNIDSVKASFVSDNRTPPNFTEDIVPNNLHNPVGDFLAATTIALDVNAFGLRDAFKDHGKDSPEDNATLKDVLKAFFSDEGDKNNEAAGGGEYRNIQNRLKDLLKEMPAEIKSEAFKTFYQGSSVFQGDTTRDEYTKIKKMLTDAFKSSGFGFEEEDIETIVNGFVNNLSTDRAVEIEVKQNSLYKVTFHNTTGAVLKTVELPDGSTFLPEGTDPAKAYKDPEVVDGYVFSGWALTLGGAKIDVTPSYDVDLYPIYTPDYEKNYNLNVTFYDFDTGLVTTAVTAGLVGGATRHYNDAVTLALTGITPSNYTLKKIEYSLDGGVSYTEGTSFNMPMKAVDVKVYVKNATIKFNQPDGVVVYPANNGEPIIITVTKPGKEINNVVYGENTYMVDPNGKLKQVVTPLTKPVVFVEPETILKADETITDPITVNLKDIDYTISFTVDANDSADVSATKLIASVDGTPETVFHYGDEVTLDVDNLPAGYTVNYVEYKADGDESYKLYDGKPIVMPAANLSVKIHLYAPVSITPTMQPAGIHGTVAPIAPTPVGQAIVITGVAPGYTLTNAFYDGIEYKVDPEDGKLKNYLGVELAAKNGVTGIKITLTPIVYNVTVNYSVPSVKGDLVSMTKTVEDTVTLAVTSLDTPGYLVSSITYHEVGSTTEKVYTGPFQMPASDIVVTVHLTVPTPPTPAEPSYGIDDIEVTGDIITDDGQEAISATVTFDRPSYKPGQLVVVTVSDIEEGYELDYISLVKDGEETAIAGTTFVMPEGGVGVNVHTKRKTYEYSIAGVPDSGLYKDTISFTVTVKQGEVMKEIPEGCVLVSAKVGENGDMELTYVFSLTENGKDVNYRIDDLSFRTLKIKDATEWKATEDPTGQNGAAFAGWSALVGETYLFAIFERTAKLNLWWLWIVLLILILIALEVIFYRKDEKDGREKGGFWKVIRAIGDAFVGLAKAFYGLFHKKK